MKTTRIDQEDADQSLNTAHRENYTTAWLHSLNVSRWAAVEFCSSGSPNAFSERSCQVCDNPSDDRPNEFDVGMQLTAAADNDQRS